VIEDTSDQLHCIKALSQSRSIKKFIISKQLHAILHRVTAYLKCNNLSVTATAATYYLKESYLQKNHTSAISSPAQCVVLVLTHIC
jgi:hypothetical protein